MDEPKVEEVLRNVYDLYENPDISAKDKASKWLAEFQKSVSDDNCHAKDFFKVFFLLLDFLLEDSGSTVAAEE